jgi:hypothetical protein
MNFVKEVIIYDYYMSNTTPKQMVNGFIEEINYFTKTFKLIKKYV